MMKVGNFTPSCIPINVAQISTKIPLLFLLLLVKESIKQDIAKETKQKVSELYERIRPWMPYKINGVNVIRAVYKGDQLLLELHNFSLTVNAKNNPDSK